MSTEVDAEVRSVRTTPTLSGRAVTPALLIALGLLSAVAPFATDLYLPAFPQMTEELGASPTAVQLTLTAFLVGVTGGQLIFGPLSDRFGRMPPLVGGAALCVLASAAAVLAPNVPVLITVRVLQGLGGAAGMVIGRAVISDLATGKPAARAFSLMMIVTGVAPVIAPLLGGFLTVPIGWRGLLAIVLALSILMIVTVLTVVRETHPPEHRETLREQRRSSRSPLRALRSRAFIGYTGTLGFGFGVMMAYISASPFVYQKMMGFSTAAYGLTFGINALAFVTTSFLSARLAATRPIQSILTTGIMIVLTSTATLTILTALDVPPIWLTAPLFITVGGIGLVLGNATALALGAIPSAAGTGSAVLGALQFGLAAAASPLVSIHGEDTTAPLATVMLTSAAIALSALLLARSSRTKAPR
jgi:DHA1 family bicyclomycin/chloramphenicol resistance-like MFS transporter